MRIHDLLLSGGALAVAALLLLPASSQGFTTIGGTLDLSQRGFRVFDNFTDPTASSNQSPHPRFPGATGAVMAIWKACVEWGSELHGDGSGDPHQPFDLGSGGANFDASFRGLASDPGGTNDNVFSQISGLGAGVLAFTELPIHDGWRIRFYSDPWIWHDGPGPPTGTSPQDKDIQGVAAHEYGHALGLGHSDLGTTMQASGSGNLVHIRSIEADDIAGVQFLYGVRSATKPRVTGYSLAAGQVIVEGEHFAATGNELWFTHAGIGDGSPVTASGLPSSDGGTRIVAPVPAQAGPGDLLVRVPGDRGDALSNAFPFDPLAGYCAGPTRYGQSKPTSSGTSPDLFSSGLPSATWNDFVIGTAGAPANQPGILFSGPAPAAQPFFGGTLLVGGPFVRERMFQADFLGDVELPFPVTPSMAGTTRYFQMWFQDPGDPFGVGLSDAFEVTFCP